MSAGPRSEYERRRDASREAAARLDGQSAWLGWPRVLLVGAAIVLAGRALLAHQPQPWTAHAVLAALFVVLLVIQLLLDARRRTALARVAHYERWLARLDGKWTAFASTGEAHLPREHPYAQDLDLFGRGSMFQLLDTTRTAQGAATLAGWLLAPVARPEIEARREAVRALAPALDGREALALAGGDADVAHVDHAPLVAWAAEKPQLGRPWLWPAMTVLPLVTIAALLGFRWDVVSGWIVAGLMLLHVVVIALTRRPVNAIARAAEQAESALARVLPLLRAARSVPATGARLQALHESLAGALDATQSLRRRVTVFQSRANLFVAVVAPLLLYDIHAALLLERWKARAGARLADWFRALGELEALCAMATYADEHPGDAWPEVVEGPLRFESEALGHPLLPEGRCVRNDVRLGGPGTVLLVTGSNMSGKSTLLRATGLNAVLALTGLPVRAARLRLSVVQIATSMRVTDSLQEGASLFAAEVAGLKRVVDLAAGELPVLFLLDEILQGTNTRERSLGARGVVAHLLRLGAAGLVSTHDLSLVRLGETLGERVAYAHFEDQLVDGKMAFDYRMRPGVVSTSNALRLMKSFGLEVEVPAE